MKRWIYLGSIILGVYLAYGMTHRQQSVVTECRSGVRIEYPPPALDAIGKLLVFDEQRPLQEWVKVPPAFESVEQCKRVIAEHMEAALPISDMPENTRRTYGAMHCVCADDSRFN